jgi:hypothetical protein
LAWLFLITSALALALQGRLLCRRIDVLGVFAPLPRRLSLQTLAIARHTVAEPCANWVRLSLPVLVIAAISTPGAVTTYVALRAAFGAGRSTIQQLARVASVEYLRFRASGRTEAAGPLLALFVLLAAFFGTGVASFIVADNMRVLGLWLTRFDRSLFQTIVLSFAVSASFYSYQIVLGLMFRSGELAWVARRHWAYVLYSALFAVAATQTKWLPLYLAALAFSEILLSASFLLPRMAQAGVEETAVGRRGLVAGFVGSAIVVLFWFAVRRNVGNIFADFSSSQLTWTAFVTICGLVMFAVVNYLSNADLFKSLPLLLGSPGRVEAIPGSYARGVSRSS